jgi:hypothetical protein
VQATSDLTKANKTRTTGLHSRALCSMVCQGKTE